MGDLEVDVDGLEALVVSLAGVRAGLEETRSVVDGSATAMGSADVAGALGDFESHWDDGRGRIKDNIDAIVGAVEESARAYRQADNDLRDALQAQETETPGNQPR